MQGSTPWGDLPDDGQQKSIEAVPQSVLIGEGFSPMAEGSMLGGNPQFAPGQIVYLQPPSGAPKVIGILVIIYAAFGILTGLIDLVLNISTPNLLLVFSALGLAFSVATAIGGVMLTRYERRGVHLLLLTILASTALGGVQVSMIDEVYDDMLANGELTQDDYDLAMESNGLIQGLGAVFLAICGGMCALIVAIPLMVSNNGLDESKLFG